MARPILVIFFDYSGKQPFRACGWGFHDDESRNTFIFIKQNRRESEVNDLILIVRVRTPLQNAYDVIARVLSLDELCDLKLLLCFNPQFWQDFKGMGEYKCCI